MNRRRFLSALATLAAGVAVDPERLIWTPGAKTLILPPQQGWKRVADGVWRHEDATRILTAVNRTVEFTPERFPMVDFNPPITEEMIAAMSKALAEKIDADALRLYEQQAIMGLPVALLYETPKDEVLFTARLDVLHGYDLLEPEDARKMGVITGLAE